MTPDFVIVKFWNKHLICVSRIWLTWKKKTILDVCCFYIDIFTWKTAIFNTCIWEIRLNLVNFYSAGYHGNGTCKPNFNYIYAVIGWSLPLCESFIWFWDGAWNGSMGIFWCSQRIDVKLHLSLLVAWAAVLSKAVVMLLLIRCWLLLQLWESKLLHVLLYVTLCPF